MSSSVAANVLKEIPRLSRAIQKATNADGITVLSNSGSAAGQVVFHSHIHIVPRYEGDGLGEFVQIRSKASIQPEEANEILTSIQSHLENE
jgi:histidine triad (HIT) family protein